MEKLNKVAAIKRYFESDGGRPITLSEMRALTGPDRDELGAACAKALGCELEEVK